MSYDELEQEQRRAASRARLERERDKFNAGVARLKAGKTARRYKSYFRKEWKVSLLFGLLLLVGLVLEWSKLTMMAFFVVAALPFIKDSARKFIRNCQKDEIDDEDE
jgi:hypothetical protein